MSVHSISLDLQIHGLLEALIFRMKLFRLCRFEILNYRFCPNRFGNPYTFGQCRTFVAHQTIPTLPGKPEPWANTVQPEHPQNTVAGLFHLPDKAAKPCIIPTDNPP